MSLRKLLSRLALQPPAEQVRTVERLRREDRPDAGLATAHLLEFGHWQHSPASRQIEIPTSFFPDARSPTAAAALIRSKLVHGHAALAAHLLDLALKRFAVTIPSPLTRLADDIVRAGVAAGWVGVNARLGLVGRVASTFAGTAVVVNDGSRTIASSRPASSGAFRLPDLVRSNASQLSVQCGGQPLLGGLFAWPLQVDLAGETRIDPELNTVSGWLRVEWLGSEPPQLELVDAHGLARGLRPRWNDISKTWTIRTRSLKSGSGEARYSVRIVLPDGRTATVAGAPLVPAADARRTLVPSVSAAAASRRSATLAASRTIRRPIAAIIVLEREDLDARPCLEAVLEQIAPDDRMLVIDAGSPDQHLCDALVRLHAEGRLEFLRMPEGSSSAAAANHATSLCPECDVLLVDARAILMRESLDRLLETAGVHADSGTVSALSNQPAIARYPSVTSHAFSWAHAETLVHGLAAYPQPSAELPVLATACVFIRRTCLDDVGPLDARLFNRRDAALIDFSMQASRRRWTHQLAARAFVYQAAGPDWQSSAAAWPADDDALLRVRHPASFRAIERFAAHDPLQPLRRSLDEHQLRDGGQEFVLILTLARGGGVDRFVAERCTAIRQQGLTPLLLRARDAEQGPVMLWTDAYPAQDLVYHPGRDLDRLRRLLAALPIRHIELQHFLGIAPAVVEACLSLGPPCDIVVHDYIWICPRISLMGPAKQYCGEPASTRTCDQCVRVMGSTLGERGINTAALRERSGRWLASARRVVVPSQDVVARLRRYFPGIDFTPVPHEVEPDRARVRARGTTPVRVGLLGSLTRHKGYEVLLRCARYVRRNGLPVEFVLIGSSMHDGPLLSTGRVSITGPYSDSEIAELITRERLDVIWLPSVWPETWSYTLTHAIRSGLPIVAFDIGAIGERIRALQCGILSPLSSDPRQLIATLIQAAAPDGIGNSQQ